MFHVIRLWKRNTEIELQKVRSGAGWSFQTREFIFVTAKSQRASATRSTRPKIIRWHWKTSLVKDEHSVYSMHPRSKFITRKLKIYRDNSRARIAISYLQIKNYSNLAFWRIATTIDKLESAFEGTVRSLTRKDDHTAIPFSFRFSYNYHRSSEWSSASDADLWLPWASDVEWPSWWSRRSNSSETGWGICTGSMALRSPLARGS